MKRKQWFTQKTPPTTMGFDHLIFDGSERYLAWVGTEEDARLIAASPDLYEALAEIINNGGKFVMTQDTHRKARAALAKARGEA